MVGFLTLGAFYFIKFWDEAYPIVTIIVLTGSAFFIACMATIVFHVAQTSLEMESPKIGGIDLGGIRLKAFGGGALFIILTIIFLVFNPNDMVRGEPNVSFEQGHPYKITFLTTRPSGNEVNAINADLGFILSILFTNSGYGSHADSSVKGLNAQLITNSENWPANILGISTLTDTSFEDFDVSTSIEQFTPINLTTSEPVVQKDFAFSVSSMSWSEFIIKAIENPDEIWTLQIWATEDEIIGIKSPTTIKCSIDVDQLAQSFREHLEGTSTTRTPVWTIPYLTQCRGVENVPGNLEPSH